LCLKQNLADALDVDLKCVFRGAGREAASAPVSTGSESKG